MRRLILTVLLALAPLAVRAESLLLLPDAVFDGMARHAGWAVLVTDGRIAAAGPTGSIAVPGDARRIDLAGMTLLPGLIEAHSHILLHPYDETAWNDQVLTESRAERVARAVMHLRAHLEAGFTTLRDLGTEGAGYADVGLRTAIEKGVIMGPRLVVAGPAIVATGSYGPKGFAPHVSVPLGAEEADGTDLIRVARRQIGHGIDVVKVYADYRWGPDGSARPTFSLEELASLVRIAADSGRPVVAHAATAEGMRRATLAGVRSIEHGDEGTDEVFALMAARGVFYCPTLAAGEAVAQYQGWRKGRDPEPERVTRKKETFRRALAAGVPICMGSDVGVFT
ncbi:MAG: amidohydrolase family protein, partial [Alphaproteobacteria bacterium]